MVETALCKDEAEVKAFVKARYGGVGEDEGGSARSPHRDDSSCNMFVVKDSSTNGAGGVWILSDKNKTTYFDPELTPLLSYGGTKPSYVIQKYSYPLMLTEGRKTHIRIYGLLHTNPQGGEERHEQMQLGKRVA